MDKFWNSPLDCCIMIIAGVSIFECFIAALCCSRSKSISELEYRLNWVFVFLVYGIVVLVFSTKEYIDILCKRQKLCQPYCPFGKYRIWIGVLSIANSLAYLVACPKSPRPRSVISGVPPPYTATPIVSVQLNAMTNDPAPPVPHLNEEPPPPYSSLSFSTPTLTSISIEHDLDRSPDAGKSTDDEIINGNVYAITQV